MYMYCATPLKTFVMGQQFLAKYVLSVSYETTQTHATCVITNIILLVKGTTYL
jgi:hypothetical protein